MRIVKYMPGQNREFVDGIRKQQGHGIVLFFTSPRKFYISAGRRGWKTTDKETDSLKVNNIFISTRGELCYSPGKMKNSGFPLPTDTLDRAEINETKPDYSAQWARISQSAKKYRINKFLSDDIDKHLRGESAEMRWAQNYYTRHDKPRIANFSDLARDMSIPQIIELSKPRHNCQEGYRDFRMSKDGIKRDRSISLWFKDLNDVRYTAASEYHGCGNGSYYVMFSPSLAVYAEDD